MVVTLIPWGDPFTTFLSAEKFLLRILGFVLFFQRASELWSWTSAALASLLRKCRSPSDTKSYTSFQGQWSAEQNCHACDVRALDEIAETVYLLL